MINLITTYPVLLFLIGVIAGLGLGWAVARLRLAGRQAESRSEIAALKATARSTQQELIDFKVRCEKTGEALEAMREQYLKVSNQRSAALVQLNHLAEYKTRLEQLYADKSRLKARVSHLETALAKERDATAEKIALLQEVRGEWTQAHKALAADALKANNRAFMDLAQTTLAGYLNGAQKDLAARGRAVQEIVRPIHDSLRKYDDHIRAVERSREKAYGGLSQQVQTLTQAQIRLEQETGRLAQSLRMPHVRGRWGEMTLRRVAELAGMQNRCDFVEQPSVRSADGEQRPDMVVSLPGRKQIVVDAKVPLTAYLDALQAVTEEKRRDRLQKHAGQVLNHIQQLGRKSYWKQFAPTPEFVVLFIPGENFFSAALAHDPNLIETGAKKGVILATPTTLISLLKTVALAWQDRATAANAKQIGALGRELYDRLVLSVQHINKLGQELDRTGRTFNQMVGSLDSRVMASARKLRDLGIAPQDHRELPEMKSVTTTMRKLNWKGET